jgi:uncharacterized SAM-binding protein YcdF (DUF218 family)
MIKLKIEIKRIGKFLLKFVKRLIFSLGIIFLTMIILSFTDYPYHVYHWLGTHNSEITENPDYIVVMGAGGMPGPEGLMRCHFAARCARDYTNARIIVALPSEEDNFMESDTYKMYEEVRKYGVDSARFMFETKGTNTYYQACEIFRLLKNEKNNKLLIVTSPEHMYRCVLTFQKCGFEHVSGFSSFENSYDENLLLMKDERLKNVQDIDRNISLRYNMWNYLKYEIIIIRELVAISWYKLKGYI